MELFLSYFSIYLTIECLQKFGIGIVYEWSSRLTFRFLIFSENGKEKKLV